MLVEEEVAQFKVSVNDLPAVDVLHCLNDLQHVKPDLRFSQGFSSLQQFVEGLRRGIFTLLQQS